MRGLLEDGYLLKLESGAYFHINVEGVWQILEYAAFSLQLTSNGKLVNC
jgi:hypothetical protein